MPFIFYDTETTGTRSGFDQIVQFAAILTDDNLNVVDSFNIRSRLLSHIVPSPEALLITGVSVTQLTSAPMSHFEMMRLIRAKMQCWSRGGAVFVGWNSMRFDEAMLRQAYFQTLLPIYQTNTDGNGRADMMRMAQIVANCAPNSLAIPLGDNGKRVFKLSRVAEANAIVLDNAHDALADASATLAIAKLIKQRSSALWDIMLSNARKTAPLQLIKNNPVLLLSETFGGVPYNLVVAPITTNATNANEWALFDLQFDPLNLFKADDDTIRGAIDGKVKAIRRVSINAQPSVLPLDFAPCNIRGGRLSLATYQARAQAIRANDDFRQRLSRLLAERYADQEASLHVEENIYSGFAAPADESRMTAFHDRDWSARNDIVATFADERFQRLGQRIIASERPDLLSDHQRSRWHAWRRDRLLAEGDVPWLTVAAARAQIAELKLKSLPEQFQQLAEIDRFVLSMAA